MKLQYDVLMLTDLSLSDCGVAGGSGTDSDACVNYRLEAVLCQNRYLNHFAFPPSGIPGEGLNGGRIPLLSKSRSCLSAVSWARQDKVKESDKLDQFSAGRGWTWQGSLQTFGYSPAELEASVWRLGHVQHLMADLSQGEHVNLEPHYGRDYEKWVQDNGDKVYPDPLQLALMTNFTRVLEPLNTDLEEILWKNAQLTWQASVWIGGPLTKNAPFLDAGSPFDEAFRLDHSGFISDEWSVYNKIVNDKKIAEYDGEGLPKVCTRCEKRVH